MSKTGLRVAIRTRPTAMFAQDNVIIDSVSSKIEVSHAISSEVADNRNDSWQFSYHAVYHNSNQETVYSGICSDIVSSACAGTTGAIVAYGQVGSGKTFTMLGSPHSYGSRGVIPRAISQVFREFNGKPRSDYCISVSYLEILAIPSDKIRDLLVLSGANGDYPPGFVPTLRPKEGSRHQPSDNKHSDPNTSRIEQFDYTTYEDPLHGTVVRGLTQLPVNNEEEALSAFFTAETSRITAEHFLNPRSNRSHCVFTIHILQRNPTGYGPDISSKLYLVDLAGTERLRKTVGMNPVQSESVANLQKESLGINKSLATLELVVTSLSKKSKSHVPYRSSRLTTLLKDALGSKEYTRAKNSKYAAEMNLADESNAVFIACIWAELRFMEETVSTLRMVSRWTSMQMLSHKKLSATSTQRPHTSYANTRTNEFSTSSLLYQTQAALRPQSSASFVPGRSNARNETTLLSPAFRSLSTEPLQKTATMGSVFGAVPYRTPVSHNEATAHLVQNLHREIEQLRRENAGSSGTKGMQTQLSVAEQKRISEALDDFFQSLLQPRSNTPTSRKTTPAFRSMAEYQEAFAQIQHKLIALLNGHNMSSADDTSPRADTHTARNPASSRPGSVLSTAGRASSGIRQTAPSHGSIDDSKASVSQIKVGEIDVTRSGWSGPMVAAASSSFTIPSLQIPSSRSPSGPMGMSSPTAVVTANSFLSAPVVTPKSIVNDGRRPSLSPHLSAMGRNFSEAQDKSPARPVLRSASISRASTPQFGSAMASSIPMSPNFFGHLESTKVFPNGGADMPRGSHSPSFRSQTSYGSRAAAQSTPIRPHTTGQMSEADLHAPLFTDAAAEGAPISSLGMVTGMGSTYKKKGILSPLHRGGTHLLTATVEGAWQQFKDTPGQGYELSLELEQEKAALRDAHEALQGSVREMNSLSHRIKETNSELEKQKQALEESIQTQEAAGKGTRGREGPSKASAPRTGAANKTAAASNRPAPVPPKGKSSGRKQSDGNILTPQISQEEEVEVLAKQLAEYKEMYRKWDRQHKNAQSFIDANTPQLVAKTSSLLKTFETWYAACTGRLPPLNLEDRPILSESDAYDMMNTIGSSYGTSALLELPNEPTAPSSSGLVSPLRPRGFGEFAKNTWGTVDLERLPSSSMKKRPSTISSLVDKSLHEYFQSEKFQNASSLAEIRSLLSQHEDAGERFGSILNSRIHTSQFESAKSMDENVNYADLHKGSISADSEGITPDIAEAYFYASRNLRRGLVGGQGLGTRPLRQ